MGVKRGKSSLMGGFILPIPTSITILFNAPKMLPRTSGYSSLKHPSKFSPNPPNLVSYPQTFMLWAIFDTKSAACCRILMVLFPNLQFIVPTICIKNGLALNPNAFTIAPSPFKTTASSVVCFWKAYKAQSIKEFLKFSGACPISLPF